MQSAATPMDPAALAPGLRRLARRLADPHGADDLVQSSWVRALESGAAAVRSPAAWMRTILRNEHRMAIRGSRRMLAREEAVADLDDATPIDPERDVQQREVARIVAGLVADLDDDVRDVVRQRYFEGLSAAEIARASAIPAGTVRWRLKLGMDRLRAQLDARYGGDRMLWAGAFFPLPTLGEIAASQASTAATNTAATTKGTSAMIAKLLIGAVLVGGTTAGAVAWKHADAPAKEREVTAVVAAVPAAAVQNERRVETKADRESIRIARERWAARVDGIQAAHAQRRAEAQQDEAGEDCVQSCSDQDCLVQLATQVSELVQGCDELAGELPPNVRLTAHVIGTPELGAVVESVTLDGATDVPPELGECLTESMYALELAPMGADFEQDIAVMMRSSLLDAAVVEEATADEPVWLQGEAAAELLAKLKAGELPEGSSVMVLERDEAPK